MILPGCDERCTGNQAERMRAALANEPMLIGDVSHLVTCSFGATSWRPDATSTADELIHLADDALYLAKGQGRNCVAVLTPPGAETVAKPSSGSQGSG
jgi:diguanylate cyclase (GGDEF)-like protein